MIERHLGNQGRLEAVIAAGALYAYEVRAPLLNQGCVAPRQAAAAADGSHDADRRTSLVEIQTLGGWVSTLKVLAMVRGTMIDQRRSITHLLELPVIPFRLAAGGIGFINPANIARARAYPTPDALPETA
jgi:hypothetical protein